MLSKRSEKLNKIILKQKRTVRKGTPVVKTKTEGDFFTPVKANKQSKSLSRKRVAAKNMDQAEIRDLLKNEPEDFGSMFKK